MSDKQVADLLRKTSDPFLRSLEWRELRARAVERYGLICCKCGRENSRRFPINMDHVKPRKFFPELSLCIENLQPLCGPCNKAKGNKNTNDYRVGSKFMKWYSPALNLAVDTMQVQPDETQKNQDSNSESVW